MELPEERTDEPDELRLTEDPLLVLPETPDELRVRTVFDTFELVDDPLFVVTFEEEVPRLVVTFEERSTDERLFTELFLTEFSREVEGLEFTFSLVLEDVEVPSLNEVLRLDSLPLRTVELLSEEERADMLLPPDISDCDPDER